LWIRRVRGHQRCRGCNEAMQRIVCAGRTHCCRVCQGRSSQTRRQHVLPLQSR
ncbi:hypothetical protein IWW45_009552, partial [Coemansia sp. RSA 485]